MNDVTWHPNIAVVIATKDRGALLSERALASVAAQTRIPGHLVVADDSSPNGRSGNRNIVSSVSLPNCLVTYLENERTVGASGSWNTAIDFLLRQVEDPADLFVAILDDDDAWTPDYLERCLALARDQALDMVAADILRIETTDDAPVLNTAPESLRASDFLTGNPGIQGSNLFVRLNVLLAAGAFDEEFGSTTDRDICIRISDLGTVRYGRLALPLVRHYADAGRPRLSTRGSELKLDGLTSFWHKYGGRMTSVQRDAFCERARALFDWCPPVSESPHAEEVPKCPLVLGVVAHNERPDELLGVIRDLREALGDGLIGLDVALLEAGTRGNGEQLLEVAATELREAGIGCFRFPLEQQAGDAQAGIFGEHFERSSMASPAEVCTMLQTYASHIAHSRKGTAVWIAAGHPPQDRISVGDVGGPRGGGLDDALWRMGAEQIESVVDAVAPVRGGRASGDLIRWIDRERVATAEQWVRRSFALESLRLLGCGSESVVFTDELAVYKCIDYWKTRTPQVQLDFLREQIGRWENVVGLYALREVVVGRRAVLVYDYEPSTPYCGGHEQDLIGLLDGCWRVGIVCNNVHPKNLVVSAAGVKLIDYGSDIRPWTPLGFEHMVRRTFLACRQSNHPELQSLMRRVLTDVQFPEMSGYSRFRAKFDAHSTRVPWRAGVNSGVMSEAPAHDPFALYVGVISSDPVMLRPLLDGLACLRSSPSIERLSVVVLDNGTPAPRLEELAEDARRAGLQVAVISEPIQCRDAASGAFGTPLSERPGGQVGIAQARTMLQRYLGTLLSMNHGSFGWILDDDMRVDDRALTYLPWLPAFRGEGVDVLIGHYEGSSPNPPINGLRVHLVDLLHNLIWLRGLHPHAILPDRTTENAALRARYPDYYYDLSRKHTGHLEMPHWLEPVARGETVGEAYARLLAGALGILSGDPLTRPIIASMPANPLASAKDSVNRGGCTFILNHRALTLTPNTTPRVQGREARRSDMIWAIVNRYYRRLQIKSVGFPIQHVGRVAATPSLNIEKVQGEIIGSSLYAGLTDFLGDRPHHALDFSSEETEAIWRLATDRLNHRMRSLEQSFYRIAGLRGAIRSVAKPGELEDLLEYLGLWFTQETFAEILSGVRAQTQDDVERFLISLRNIADDYASATVDTRFIHDQLQCMSGDERQAQH